MTQKTIDFINKAVIIHGKRYEYSKSEYYNAHTKLTITCPIHGDFLIRPSNHIGGHQGCKKCGIERRPQNKTKSIENFILNANIIHKNKYDYSKAIYTDSYTKLIITCPVHGDFLMRPNAHIGGHQGCKLCNKNRYKSVNDYQGTTKICKSCNKEKLISEYYIDNGYYRGNCKDCEKAIKVEYRKDPINKKQLRLYHRKYKNNRRKNDPAFRLRCDIPTIIRRSIKKKYYNDSIWNYLPYTPIELKEHLEKQFDDKMSWDNHGTYWHIDHIIPKVAFHYDSETHPDFIKCWRLENLRPLRADENMKKSSIYNGKRLYSKYL